VPDPGVPAPGVVEILGRLAQATAAGDVSATELGGQLARAGPAALPDLFTVLSGGAREEPLAELEHDALVEALASFGAPPLRAYLEHRLQDAIAPASAPRCSRCWGESARGSTWPWRAAASRRRPRSVASRCLCGTPRVACSRAIPAGSATPSTGSCRPRRGRAGARARPGDSARPEALPVLCALLGMRGELDLVLLPEIGRVVEHAPRPLEESDLTAVRRMLEADDAQLLREAALAEGHAADALAAPGLVRLLGHENRGVREAAAWALETADGPAPARRRGALERLAARRARLVPRGRSAARARARGEPGRDRRAGAGRGEPAPPAPRRARAGRGEDAGARHARVRRLGCTVLERLGSPVAVPALRATLADEDPTVAAAAREALSSLGAPAAGEPEESSLSGPASRNGPDGPRSLRS
jgi:hypothetical protein